MTLNKFMQDDDSLAAKPRKYQQAITRDIHVEPTPFAHSVQISKGTVQTNLGGVLQLKDKTGGTNIFTYDPATGTVTILGPLVAQQVNTGTYTNVSISGTTIFSGTMTSTGIISGGTVGTAQITGGTLSTNTINNAVMGTPAITGGTYTNPQIAGTPNLAVNAGTAALSANGDFALQTLSGSVILVARSGGTNFYFTAAGIL